MQGNIMKHTNEYFSRSKDDPSDKVDDKPPPDNPNDPSVRQDTFIIFDNDDDDPFPDYFFDMGEIDENDFPFWDTGFPFDENPNETDDTNITNNPDLIGSMNLTNNTQMTNDAHVFNDKNTTRDSNNKSNKKCSRRVNLCVKRHYRYLPNKKSKLQKRMYSLFGKYERFPKKYVKILHDLHISVDLHFDKMTRDEFRSIGLYFEKYECYSDEILQYLEKNRDELKAEFDDYDFKI